MPAQKGFRVAELWGKPAWQRFLPRWIVVLIEVNEEPVWFTDCVSMHASVFYVHEDDSEVSQVFACRESGVYRVVDANLNRVINPVSIAY